MLLTQKLRKVGNSLVITVPKEEADRLGLSEGDFVGAEVRKMNLRPEMSPEMRVAFERALTAYQEDLRYLAER